MLIRSCFVVLTAFASASCVSRPSKQDVLAQFDTVEAGASDWQTIECLFPRHARAEFVEFGRDRYLCSVAVAEGGVVEMTFDLEDGVVVDKESREVEPEVKSGGKDVREGEKEG